jgi:hypothetical protein
MLNIMINDVLVMSENKLWKYTYFIGEYFHIFFTEKNLFAE